MRKLYTIIFILSFSVSFAQLDGIWEVAKQAGAIGVGPELGNITWWSNSEDDLTLRACYFDDRYIFHEDGTFNNKQDNESWIEEWQDSDPPTCTTPVAPHDGSNAATWTYDAAAGTITLNGAGAYLGLAKVINDGELSSPANAPESITYMVAFSPDEDTMTIDISIGSGYWRYIMVKESAAGLNEKTTLQARIFPNPASDVIHIENAKAFMNVSVYSITGQLMYKSGQSVNEINISNFPQGIYTFHANGLDGKRYLTKFMVQ